MAGRAGRKGIDTCGESILMCSNANEKKIAQCLISTSLIPEMNFTSNFRVQSSNDDALNCGVKRALLETIVSGIACSKHDVIEYINCFLSTRIEKTEAYDRYIKWLNQNRFIDINQNSCEGTVSENYKPTQLGYAVVGAAMSPDEGLVIFSELQKGFISFYYQNSIHSFNLIFLSHAMFCP